MISEALEKAYALAEDRRRRGERLFCIFSAEADSREAVDFLSRWWQGRGETESRLRKIWGGAEQNVWLGDVFEVWAEMAQEELASNTKQTFRIAVFPAAA